MVKTFTTDNVSRLAKVLQIEMSKWAKLIKVQALVKPLDVIKKEEEIVVEDYLYKIEETPDPKYKFKIFRSSAFFRRTIQLDDSGIQAKEDILPCQNERKNFIMKEPIHKSVGFHVSVSHSDMNTSNKETAETGMNHVEGGWPEHVKTEIAEHRNKFIRQTCKEDMFKWTATKLMERMEKIYYAKQCHEN